MLFYGAGTKTLGAQDVQAACPQCGHGEQQLLALQRYFHVYWIPLFPLPKVIASVCAHCKTVTASENFSDTIKAVAPAFRASLSTPPILFAGLFLAALGGAAAGYLNHQHKGEVAQAVANPQVGDVYVLHMDEPKEGNLPYTYVRVVEVDRVSVTLAPARFQFSAASGIDAKAVAMDENYQDISFGMPREALLDGIVEKVFPGGGAGAQGPDETLAI